MDIGHRRGKQPHAFLTPAIAFFVIQPHALHPAARRFGADDKARQLAQGCEVGAGEISHLLRHILVRGVAEAHADLPGEPTLSPKAIEALKNKRSEKAGADGKIADISSHPGYAGTVEYKTELVAAHELLGLTIKELGTPRGKPLQVTVNINTPYPEFVPEVKAAAASVVTFV